MTNMIKRERERERERETESQRERGISQQAGDWNWSHVLNSVYLRVRKRFM